MIHSKRVRPLVDFISHAPDGFDKPRVAGRLPHLLPQAADMDHDGIVPVKILLAPDGLEKFFGRDDLAPVLGQHPEDVELNGGEADGPLVERALVGDPVDDKAAEVDHVPRRGPAPAVVAGIAPELGLDAGHHLKGVEGFGHIVVGPDGEAGDLVHVLGLCREHEDGEMPVLADLPAEGEP